MERKSFFYANYFNWSLTIDPVILIPMPLLNQANHAIVVYKALPPKCSLFFRWVWKWMPPKKKKELVCFRPRLQDKRRRQNRFASKEWASKLAESDKGSYYPYYNQEKWLNDGIAPEKPIETTAESSFTSSLASGASFLGRKAAKGEEKSREVPRHVKIGRTTVLKVYCSGKEASRKTLGSGLLRFLQGSVERLKNRSSKSWLGSTWLVRWENENCPLQLTSEAFSTDRKDRTEQSLWNKLFICSRVSFSTFPAVSLLLSLLWYASTLTALGL